MRFDLSLNKLVRMYYVTRHITYRKTPVFRINLYLLSIINKLSHDNSFFTDNSYIILHFRSENQHITFSEEINHVMRNILIQTTL